MPQVFFSLIRSFASFGRPGLWPYLIVPPLAGVLVWLLAAFLWLGALTDWMVSETPLSWLHSMLGDWHLGWIATALAFIGAWVVLLSGSYLVAIAIAGVWALPGIVRALAAADYPDLKISGSDNVLRSLWVTAKAVLLYLVGWTVTLPVWLVPGMAVVHSFFWLAYLNRATFAYDAVATHASADEWTRLRGEHGGRLWILGLLSAMLAHVPLVGFFAPALAATAYAHYGLQALRDGRGGIGGGLGRSPGQPAAGAIDGEFRRE